MLFRELGATIGTKQMMGTTSMIAGLSLPVPLFNQNRGEVSRATAERDAARRDFAASTGLVESEYAGAAEAVRILTEQATRLASGPDGDFLARAQQSERIALGAYREGAVSLLQVLDASRARSEARMAYYDLLFAQHEAVVDLLFASGQDIRAFPHSPEPGPPLIMKHSQRAVYTAAALLALGCSKKPNPPAANADSAAMANMPGMAKGDTTKPGALAPGTDAGAPPASLTVTASQIAHGKILWGQVTMGLAASTAAIPGQVTTDEDRTARIGAPARGRIVTVRVNQGDRVRTGQTLVVIQSPDAGTAQSDVAKATAMVASRRAQAQYAKGARERAERLLALKAIPKQDYDRAIADDELAQSELHEAEAELSRARTAAEQMGADAATNGEIQIRAPFDGTVLTRSAVPGTFIEAGSPLLVVTDPSRLWLTVNAPEQFAGLFRLGSAVDSSSRRIPTPFRPGSRPSAPDSIPRRAPLAFARRSTAEGTASSPACSPRRSSPADRAAQR